MTQEVQVVAGVVVGDVPRQFLITRKSKAPYVGKWEFPGGKIEHNESHQDALRRELREELGIIVEIGPHIISSHHLYRDTNVNVTLHAYFAHVDEENKQYQDNTKSSDTQLDSQCEADSTEKDLNEKPLTSNDRILSKLKLIDHDQARWITLDDIDIDSVSMRRDISDDQSTLLHSQIDPEFERKHSGQFMQYHFSHDGSRPNNQCCHSSSQQVEILLESEEKAQASRSCVPLVSRSQTLDDLGTNKLRQDNFMPADIPILRKLAELSYFIDISPRLRL